MKIENNRAFTMVELLATITLLGLLMAIAIGSISGIMEKSKNEYYKNQKDNIILATQSYVQDDRSKLPKNIGQKVKISLKELLDKKYLKEPIKDYGKEKCDMENSYVEITKVSKNDYSYNVILNCPASSEDIKNDTHEPTITINFSGTNNGNAKAIISIVGNDKLVSYNYIVYYRENSTSSYREAKNSGSVAVNSKDKVDVNVNLASYLPGEIKIQASATNSYGNTKSANKFKSYIDVTPPKCVYGQYEYKAGATDHIPWSKDESRTVTIGCEDDGSGCVKDTYSATFKKSTEFSEIIIADKNGNTNTCKIAVYLDNVKPTCGNIANAGTAATWKNNFRDVTVACNDNLSGCELNTYTKKITVSSGQIIRDDYIQIKDKAGNSENCKVGVYLEAKKPLCKNVTNAGTTSTWQKTPREVTVECYDGESGCQKTDFSKKFIVNSGEAIKKDYVQIKDKAGNIKDCSVGVYLDAVKPTCPDKNLGWISGSRTTSVSCKDSHSGCVKKTYSVNVKSSGSNKVTVKDKAGNTNKCTVKALIDSASPVCGSYQYVNITQNACTVSLGCSDAGVGCTSQYYTQTFSKPNYVGNIDIFDKLGHSRTCQVPLVYAS